MWVQSETVAPVLVLHSGESSVVILLHVVIMRKKKRQSYLW